MLHHSDAIRGLRWGALAVTIALAAVAVVKITGKSPAMEPSEEAALERIADEETPAGFTAGPGTPLVSDSNDTPPVVPPPPPLASRRPQPVRATRTYAIPALPLSPPSARELRDPIILGLDDAPLEEIADPLETVEVAIAIDDPEAPHRPVIINHAKGQRRDHPAMRLVKSVGRVFGVGD